MDVAITGSHGLIGRALADSLRADGHTVRPIVRTDPGPGAVGWDIPAGRIDAAGLEGVDAVVNLAGRGLGRHPWTDAEKRRIHDSRVDGTRLLAEALAGLDRPPAVLVSGSAVGIYGEDRGDQVLTESSTVGDDFLATVCRDWEAATLAAEAAGIRVVHARTGIVLSPTGGALAVELPIFRLGLGGQLGDGRHWLSWISLADQVGAIRHLLDGDVSGPVNLCAPEPVRNAEFTEALGGALHRPTVLRVPRLVCHAPFGLGELVRGMPFASQRVAPAALEASSYAFAHRDVSSTLQAML